VQHLIVLVDALGWLTAQRLGFLAERLPYRRRLTTVFGYSSTAVPSLLTGAMPREHEHWFLFRRARGRSPFREGAWVDRLPGNLGRRWRVRSRLQELWRRRAGIEGYFSMYDVPLRILAQLEPVEVNDTWAPGAFPSTPSLIDVLEQRGGPYHVSNWRVPAEVKIATARDVIAAGETPVVVLYLTGVDSAQHRHGTEDPAFDRVVLDTGRAVEELADLMARNGDMTLSLFSDHGMTDVFRHEDLLRHLSSRDLERSRDFDGFLDSTVARFWNIKHPDRLAAALDELDWGHRLDPAALKAWGVDFPDNEYGDVFFLVDPGVLLLPSDMGSEPIAAMHGYDPADPTSDACFLADREVPLREDHITAVLPGLRKRLEDGR